MATTPRLTPVLLASWRSVPRQRGPTRSELSADRDEQRSRQLFSYLLANGYVSTLSTPRGTEATPAYIVGSWTTRRTTSRDRGGAGVDGDRLQRRGHAVGTGLAQRVPLSHPDSVTIARRSICVKPR